MRDTSQAWAADAQGARPMVSVAETGQGTVHLPAGFPLASAEFGRAGPDLVLTAPDGAQAVVRDFFAAANPPDLSTGSAFIDGSWALRLVGPLAPGQYAQAAGPGTIAADGEAIGKVQTTVGTVTVQHVDGSSDTLAVGDPVFPGDVLITAKGGSIGILFADDTSFALGENGRIALDEMVYDPAANAGTMTLNLTKGVFSFVSGQIAKTGMEAMTVKTAVATIGIRGTTGVISLPEGEGLQVVLAPDPGGFTGEIIVTNAAGTVVLNQPYQLTSVLDASVSPLAPVTMSAQQFNQQFASMIDLLPPQQGQQTEPPGQNDTPGQNGGPGQEGSLTGENGFADAANAGRTDGEQSAEDAGTTEGEEAAQNPVEPGGLPDVVQLVTPVTPPDPDSPPELPPPPENLDQTFTGTAGADFFEGGAGNDLFIMGQGGAGLDQLMGGAGSDTVSYAQVTGSVTVDLAGNQATAGAETAQLAEIENAIGGSGNDTLTGDENNNALSGGDGADTLIATEGNDALAGGAGVDTVNYEGFQTVVDLTAGTAAKTDGMGTDSVSGIENVLAGTNDDWIAGDAAVNTLDGGDGNDTIIGVGWGDSLNGGNGIDTVSYEGASVDVTIEFLLGTASGGTGTDTLSDFENATGGSGNDNIYGDNGDNVLSGNAGNDFLWGENGVDTFYGGDGNDLMDGGNGGDSYFGGNGNDTLTWGAGDQVYDGGAGTDTITTANQINLGAGGVSYESIERISIDLGDAEVLGIEQATVMDLAATGSATWTLTIDGDNGDTVTGAGVWNDLGVDSGYHVYQQGNATIRVDTEIDTVNITT